MDNQRKYKQLDTITYLQSTYAKEQWVRISGSCLMNDSKAGFWCGLVTQDKVETVLNNCGWDINRDSGYPGFICDSNGRHYHRWSEEGFENLVFYRSFYGIKNDYVEIAEEFKLLNNLYYDNSSNKYYAIKDNGEFEEVVRLDGEDGVQVKLSYLVRYATVKQMAILLFFDIRTEFDGSLKENGFEEFSDSFKSEDLYYEIWSGEFSLSKSTAFSVLMGKKVIFPKPIDECGYWPYEKERVYEDYIIGIDEVGEPKRFTSNPNKLANYFGANPTAPHYLTPVFFKKEVLQKYISHPDIYEVSDGYLSCQSLWGMEIDNNHKSCVSAYLGDLGRDLPEEEQLHWKSYNILSDEKLSKTAFLRDFGNISAEAEAADLRFKSAYSEFNADWQKKYRWCFFKELSEADKYNFCNVRIPLSESQEEFDQQVLSLVKVLIDSINVKEITKTISISGEEHIDGSINVLERWFEEKGVEGYTDHVKFLRNLQELRSSGTGHRKGKNYDKIINKLEFAGKPFIDSFEWLLIQAIDFISFLQKMI